MHIGGCVRFWWLCLMLAGIYQESCIQHDEHEIDNGTAEKDWVEAAEEYMIDEDSGEGGFAIDTQADDIHIPEKVSGHIVVPDAEDKGERQPGLEKGEIVGMEQVKIVKCLTPKHKKEASPEEVPQGPNQEDASIRLLGHRQPLRCALQSRLHGSPRRRLPLTAHTRIAYA
jgi:hypothetical protein